MAKRARFSNLFDTYDHGPRQHRRRIAARLCMGQSLAEMARLEGVTITQMSEIIHHPLIRQLATLWMAFLYRIRDNRDLDLLTEQARRATEHELEWPNLPMAVFLCKLSAFVGSPWRGILEFVARRFCRLALKCMVRRKPRPRDPDASRPELPEPTPAELEKRNEFRQMMKKARANGMGGGLDLRYLPGNWKRGVTDSLFRKMAHLIECRWEMLVADNPRFERPKPDPGPFWPKYKGVTRVYAPAGETEWRYLPADVRGGYPGAFPVSKSGRVLTATVDIRVLSR